MLDAVFKDHHGNFMTLQQQDVVTAVRAHTKFQQPPSATDDDVEDEANDEPAQAGLKRAKHGSESQAVRINAAPDRRMTLMELHQITNHTKSPRNLLKLYDAGGFPGIILTDRAISPCEDCAVSKIAKRLGPSVSNQDSRSYQHLKPYSSLSLDIQGHQTATAEGTVSTIEPIVDLVYGYKYLLVVTCMTTRMVHVLGLKEKGHAYHAFKMFVEYLRRLDYEPMSVQSDNDGVFTQPLFENLVQDLGLRRIPTVPYASHTNGKAERAIGIIKQAMVTILRSANLPPQYFYLAAMSAANAHNHTPSTVDNQSPMQRLTGRPSTAFFQSLGPFGCDAVALRHVRGSLDPRGRLGMFITTSDRYNSFILYCRKTNRLFRSYHAKLYPDSPFRLPKGRGEKHIEAPQLRITGDTYLMMDEVTSTNPLSKHMLTQASQTYSPTVAWVRQHLICPGERDDPMQVESALCCSVSCFVEPNVVVQRSRQQHCQETFGAGVLRALRQIEADIPFHHIVEQNNSNEHILGDKPRRRTGAGPRQWQLPQGLRGQSQSNCATDQEIREAQDRFYEDEVEGSVPASTAPPVPMPRERRDTRVAEQIFVDTSVTETAKAAEKQRLSLESATRAAGPRNTVPAGPPVGRARRARETERRARLREKRSKYLSAVLKDSEIGNLRVQFKGDKRGKSGERWNSYSTAQTIREALSRGATTADIKWDYERGLMSFVAGDPVMSEVQRRELDAATDTAVASIRALKRALTGNSRSSGRARRATRLANSMSLNSRTKSPAERLIVDAFAAMTTEDSSEHAMTLQALLLSNQRYAESGDVKKSATSRRVFKTLRALTHACLVNFIDSRVRQQGDVDQGDGDVGMGDDTPSHWTNQHDDDYIVANAPAMVATIRALEHGVRQDLDAVLPKSPSEVVEGSAFPDADLWRDAFELEVQRFKDLGTVTEVPATDIPRHVTPTKIKWVVKRKINSDGTLGRCRCRAVLQGCSQKFGESFFETNVASLSMTTVRIMFALAASIGQHLHLMDISGAYLYSQMDTDLLYALPPPGYRTKREVNGKMVDVYWHIRGSMYGARQAGRQWYRHLTDSLYQLGFTRFAHDACTFYRVQRGKPLFVCIYVDDLVCLPTAPGQVEELEEQLSQQYNLTHEAKMDKFLGMLVSQGGDGVKVSAKQIIEKVLHEFADYIPDGKASSRPTPLPSGYKRRTDLPPSNSEFPFRKLMGFVSFISYMCRPDLSHVLTVMGKQVTCFNQEDEEAAIWLLGYLNKSKDLHLHYKPDTPLRNKLITFSDASYSDDGMAVGADVIMLNGAAVCWRSYHSKGVKHSTGQAEAEAIYEALRNVMFARELMHEFGFSQEELSLPIYTDSQTALKQCLTWKNTSRGSKNYKLTINFIKEQLAAAKVHLKYVDTKEQLADLLTKHNFTVAQFDQLVEYVLGIGPRTEHEKFMQAADVSRDSFAPRDIDTCDNFQETPVPLEEFVQRKLGRVSSMERRRSAGTTTTAAVDVNYISESNVIDIFGELMDL